MMPTSFRVLKFYPLWIMGGLIAVWFGWAWWMFAGLFISCLGLYYTAVYQIEDRLRLLWEELE